MTEDSIEELRCHVGLDLFSMNTAVRIATCSSPELRLVGVARLMREVQELRDEIKQLRAGKKPR